MSKFHANRPLRNGISEALSPSLTEIVSFLSAISAVWRTSGRGRPRFPGKRPSEPPSLVIGEKPMLDDHNYMQKLLLSWLLRNSTTDHISP